MSKLVFDNKLLRSPKSIRQKLRSLESYQIVSVSGFSETEMPSDGFIVLEVQGVSINANLDARSSEVGYIVMLKQEENMDRFFEWYDEVIVYPYFRDLLKLYYGIPLDAEDVPEDLSARVWVDSDMRQMARLRTLSVMEKNFSRRLLYAKIGAKTTMCFQPIDVGPFFKIIRYET